MAGRFIISDPLHTGRNSLPIFLASDFVCAEYVPGDYLEFGVFRGDSLITAYHVINSAVTDWGSRDRAHRAFSDADRADKAFARVKQNEIRFFAFDSFDGLPELEGVDADAARFAKGRYDCSEEELRGILKSRGVDNNKVTLVPGFYEDSLTQAVKDKHGLASASIVMIDCDLYSSTKCVLEFITSLVVNGTILIFDDWLAFKGDPGRGEQLACREWLDANPDLSLIPFARFGVNQQAFIVTKAETT
jgi:hypothetical protein